mmetsp:Transcript_1322/g.3818  ORF Transcript_1322/g.3818 Transcript_1322/m.3818 type:complete len:88 (-) Transcript_1322:487-750(-)
MSGLVQKLKETIGDLKIFIMETTMILILGHQLQLFLVIHVMYALLQFKVQELPLLIKIPELTSLPLEEDNGMKLVYFWEVLVELKNQ